MDKVCAECRGTFAVSDRDLDFYQRLEVSPPTRCYLCRMQRRLAHRNERHLYHRKCDLTGKQIISGFSVDKPFPVFDIDTWWSDEWSPLNYGRDYNPQVSFFKQFRELRDSVPRLALQQQRPMVNSDYCNCASKNKNR